jgi:putative ABC transport system ATP-binding protein
MHTTSPHPAALSAHGLTRVYGSSERPVPALQGIDLTLETGKFTAVMGPSGSGKSTLLNCVSGLEQATSGTVKIGGEDISNMSESQRTVFRRQRLGFVFQGFHLIPYLTAEQNVALPLRLAGRRPQKNNVRALLQAVGLPDRGQDMPAALSGGQQQRVAIARAMVASPEVLLADEPTGALDSHNARSILNLLRGSVDDMEQTILMVTHDPVAAASADTVVFLVDGRVAGQMSRPTAEAVAGQLAHLDELVANETAEVVS